jgi:hypothetical protein
MPKNIFYKNLVTLTKIEILIKKSAISNDEKEELWRIVDEIVHHRIMGCVLGTLPREHHEEFLMKLKNDPHDTELINYLEEKTNIKMSEKIRQEIVAIEKEILKDL